MSMTRHFFVSDDLDDLERLEEELERASVVQPQIHVLTLDDSAVQRRRHLHPVVSFMKKDVVHSTLIGACIGGGAALATLLMAYVAGWTEAQAGWLPFVFLAVVLLGFFTWEGGLRGIDMPNRQFLRFQGLLNAGKHVFFVDLRPDQERILSSALARHPRLSPAGTASGAPGWLVSSQHHVRRFFVDVFP